MGKGDGLSFLDAVGVGFFAEEVEGFFFEDGTDSGPTGFDYKVEGFVWGPDEGLLGCV